MTGYTMDINRFRYHESIDRERMERARRRRIRTRAAREKRERTVKRVKIAAAVIGLIMLIGLSPLSRFHRGSDVVSAHAPLTDISYKVVEVKSGDTLWSIARDNMNPGYDSIDEYIDDIRECNHLTTTRITSGCYLMIPYYEYLTE